MGRGAVEIVVQLLDVLAVIAFAVGQAKEPLFEDWVLAVPQGEPETPEQMLVAKPREPVLTPAVRSAARMIVREIVPGSAVRTVILAHRAPLPVAEIGPPFTPGAAGAGVFEPSSFGRVGDVEP